MPERRRNKHAKPLRRRAAAFDPPVGKRFRYPSEQPSKNCGGTSTITIQRVGASLRSITANNPPPAGLNVEAPVAVAIGPYHRHEKQLQVMEEAKRAALEEFCRATNRSREAVHLKMVSVAAAARGCYDARDWAWEAALRLRDMDDDEGTMDDDDEEEEEEEDVSDDSDGDDDAFARMMLLDGCFLLQFMVSMCPDDPNKAGPADPLMSRAEVHTCIDAIARDVMLLENQIPWPVLQALMEMGPHGRVPVDRFLDLMASAFDAGNSKAALSSAGSHHQSSGPAPAAEPTKPSHDDDDRGIVVGDQEQERPPPHLLGLFYRRQVGAARTQSLHVPTLSSLSSTASELAEMGVRLTASTSAKRFGDMAVAKRQRLWLFGELSMAPLVLDDLTACWLVNMAAYEASLGAAEADNFAVSSYVAVLAMLVNREEDVQELRGKRIIVSALSDRGTLEFFKWAAPHLRVGHRYYQVFQALHQYRQQRWLWIAIHGFVYRNYKTIAAVLSIAGVLVGLFKTILSLKQPQR